MTAWPYHNGELAALIRRYDWSKTSLGALATWPESMKVAISTMLHSPVAIVSLWGAEGIMIYNDAYSEFSGGRHPKLLGMPVLEAWPEVADFNRNVMKVGFAGETLTYRSQKLVLHRPGKPTDVWLDLYYSPVYGEDGKPAAVMAIVVEITDRINAETDRNVAEKALERSEERIALSLSASEYVGTWSWDIEHDIVTSDERFARLYSVDLEAANHGAPIAEYTKHIHAEDRLRVAPSIKRVVEEGGQFDEEYRLIQPDGSVKWVNARGQALKDEHGKVYRFPGVAIDITARKRLQAVAEAQKAALELSVNGGALDAALEILVRAVEEICGREVKASLLLMQDNGNALGHSVAPSLPAAYNELINGLVIGEAVGSCGTAAFRKQVVQVADIANDPLWAAYKDVAASFGLRSCWSKPIFSAAGEVLGTFALYYDHVQTPHQEDIEIVGYIAQTAAIIIERGLLQALNQQSETRWRTLAEAMPQLVWIARSSDGMCEYLSTQWEDYTGRNVQELLGHEWLQLLHPEDQARTIKSWNDAIAGNGDYDVDFRILGKDGLYRWFKARAVPVVDQKGEVAIWYGTCTDIEEMVEMRERAEIANVAKSEFLTNMSHEIRTPMNAIIGLSNILALSHPLSPRQKEFVRTLQSSASSMMELINDLLDISKIEAQTVDLEEIPFSMEQMLQAITTMMAERVSEKKITFALNMDPVLGKTYLGDPTRIRQIISNLCSNAVKFTEIGGITMTVVSEGETDGVERLRVDVTDTGIGIAQNKIAVVFDKFVQADNSITRKYGGTGLGLAITKTLAQVMGGEILVRSVEGEGSTFSMRLPLKISPVDLAVIKAAEPLKPQLTLVRPRVLLVEDYAPNVMVATSYLEEFGYDVAVASHGLEALEMAKSGDFIAILMDVQMHEMNGYDATQRIREYETTHGKTRIPIIGMTAHAMSGDRERCLSAGMDEYISKPFEPEALMATLEKFGGNKISQAS